MSAFLTPGEIDELTGIRTGRAGQTKLVRQINQLRSMGVPCLVNAAGRPVVARVVFENATPAPKPWEPRCSTTKK